MELKNILTILTALIIITFEYILYFVFTHKMYKEASK